MYEHHQREQPAAGDGRGRGGEQADGHPVQAAQTADGDLDEVDSEAADRLIDMVIQLLGEDW